MERVAGLQQEKWALEEKLVMLEQSGAAMADELVIKSELVRNVFCIWDHVFGIWDLVFGFMYLVSGIVN